MSSKIQPNIAVLFNSPYLGGAERSIIYQAHLLVTECHFTFFIPSLSPGDTKEIEDLLLKTFSTDHISISIFVFPPELFAVSRSSKFPSILGILSSAGEIFLAIRQLQLHNFSTLWCNGNKIATVVLLYAQLTKYKKTIIWHFRDYPTNQKKFKRLWKLMNRPTPYTLKTISNSHSVTQAVKSVLPSPDIKHFMVYNPLGTSLQARRITSIKTIGIVSMLAPWKGLHQIIIWASLYQTQLKNLGITHINFYGGDIYRTAGEHQNYAQQLQQLVEKFPCDLINFCGKRSPKEIYQDIDLLIHPVIQPEPFGRILIEAFNAQIPVISTALGGSKELAINNQTALTFPVYDYATLFKHVLQLTTDRDYRQHLITTSKQHATTLTSSIPAALQNALFK